MVGSHCVKTWSSTQPTVSLASAESEVQGIATAGTMGLGIQSVAIDLITNLDIKILTDASAAIGIVKKKGPWESEAFGNTRSLVAGEDQGQRVCGGKGGWAGQFGGHLN